MTVWDAIAEALAGRGQADCLLEFNPASRVIGVSARQFQLDVDELALQLSAWGIRWRHLVPLFLDNSIDFVRAFFALLKIGAVPLMVKMEYRQLELEEVFRNAEPQAILAEANHLTLLKPFLNPKQVVVERSQYRFRCAQYSETLPSREDIPEGIASINYTYRGYGYPLGAMVSHAQYLHGARVLQDGLQSRPGEKMLVILPMAHIFTLVACVLVPLMFGLSGSIALTLNPRLLGGFIRDFRIDHITSVPEIYELLRRLKDPNIDLSCLKAFVCGGSSLSAEGYEKIRNAFSIDLLHGYGLTEFTPVSRNIRGKARPGTIGPSCDGLDIRINSPQPDGTGEIQVRGPTVAHGYYRRPRESEEAYQEGWFCTGDLGRLVDEHLIFQTEIKGTRKVNGNIVDLAEVARAIKVDLEVAEAEVRMAEGVLEARLAIPTNLDFKEKSRRIKSLLRGMLAEYKIPKRMIQL